MKIVGSLSVVARFACVLLLIVASDPNPHHFYVMLRWIVCGTSVLSAFVFWHSYASTNGGSEEILYAMSVLWAWYFGFNAWMFAALMTSPSEWHFTYGATAAFFIASVVTPCYPVWKPHVSNDEILLSDFAYYGASASNYETLLSAAQHKVQAYGNAITQSTDPTCIPISQLPYPVNEMKEAIQRLYIYNLQIDNIEWCYKLLDAYASLSTFVPDEMAETVRKWRHSNADGITGVDHSLGQNAVCISN